MFLRRSSGVSFHYYESNDRVSASRYYYLLKGYGRLYEYKVKNFNLVQIKYISKATTDSHSQKKNP